MSGAAGAVALAGAGCLAGTVGSAGGITSLVSYPALLAFGLSPVSANVTNVVAVVACWPGSAWASRPELDGTGTCLRRSALVSAAGGALGSVLLLCSPSGLFAAAVPYLVVCAVLCLVAQPRVSAARRATSRPAPRFVVPAALFGVSIYNGYFGAGAGVMVLTLVLLGGDGHLARANAVKNTLVGAASVLAAVAFGVFGPVEWSAAAPLAAGMLGGSTAGPVLARRIPGSVLRWCVALSGLGLAVPMWVASR